MKYLVTFTLIATMLVSIGYVQPVASQMMCAEGDEIFHFTINDVVFIGTVTSITPSDSHRLWNYISFDVQYSFKGLTNQSEIVVPTHQGSTYGFEPEVGSKYLIHASNAYGVDLFTSLCSDNKLLETQQDVEEMKNKLLETSIPSPLKQKQFGLASHAIKCKENLVLIQKYNGSPACVKPSSISDLIKRNWTKTEVLRDMPLAQLGKECGHYSHNEFFIRMQNHTLDTLCHDFIVKKALDDEKKMLEQGYLFDVKEQVWKKKGFPDVMMSISYHYVMNLESENEN